MEPTRLTVCAIMSPPRAAHLQRWADDRNEGPSCLGLRPRRRRRDSYNSDHRLMRLPPGTRLGPYEIRGTLGAGGMGEVYRAVDTNLGRGVAVKVLPEAFAQDPERLARFEREARTLASLNHPNIAIVHGFERADGIPALVMELVDGPTLADRIATSPVPLKEALSIAGQIAGALDAAHGHGVIHRDLKPSNIKVTAAGTVKVLDFGLAKALGPPQHDVHDLTASPTNADPAMTQAGAILGTAAYMSPEQAGGHHTDKRTDIWAFGCVLYEMLTGGPAFQGASATETLARVFERDPDWNRLPADLPPRIDEILRRCLKKIRTSADGTSATYALRSSRPRQLRRNRRRPSSVGRRAADCGSPGSLPRFWLRRLPLRWRGRTSHGRQERPRRLSRSPPPKRPSCLALPSRGTAGALSSSRSATGKPSSMSARLIATPRNR